MNSDGLFKVIKGHTATEILVAGLNNSSTNIFAVSSLRQVCEVDNQKKKKIDHSGKTLKDLIGKKRGVWRTEAKITIATKTTQQNCQTEVVTSFSKQSGVLTKC